MITTDILIPVINQLPDKRKRDILKSNKEYCVLELHCVNVGSWTSCILTNDYNKYKNVSDKGNCILYTQEIAELIELK